MLKKTGRPAFICDVCETLWQENESIAAHTGHLLDSDEDMEYEIEPSERQDQEHKSAAYTKAK